MTDKVKAQHTPGPWTLEFDGDFYVNTPDVVQDEAKAVDSSLAVYVGPDRERREATARLIAAAPELLAALEGARSWIAHAGSDHDSHCAHSCNGGGPCDCPVPAMDAAIRKARGEA